VVDWKNQDYSSSIHRLLINRLSTKTVFG
jgi:hypothetical protein